MGLDHEKNGKLIFVTLKGWPETGAWSVHIPLCLFFFFFFFFLLRPSSPPGVGWDFAPVTVFLHHRITIFTISHSGSCVVTSGDGNLRIFHVHLCFRNLLCKRTRMIIMRSFSTQACWWVCDFETGQNETNVLSWCLTIWIHMVTQDTSQLICFCLSTCYNFCHLLARSTVHTHTYMHTCWVKNARFEFDCITESCSWYWLCRRLDTHSPYIYVCVCVCVCVCDVGCIC